MPATQSPARARAQLRKLLESGDAVRLREQARMPRTELANILGVDQSTLYRWETSGGRVLPRRADVAVAWVEVLDDLAIGLEDTPAVAAPA